MPGRYRAWPRIPFDLDQVFGDGRSYAAPLGRAAQRLNRVESLIRAFRQRCECEKPAAWTRPAVRGATRSFPQDRKSTRLNSSHSSISYAVFCLKKKKKNKK